jgi:hypothetical protein
MLNDDVIQQTEAGFQCRAIHMAPPFGESATQVADIVGCLDDLQPDEQAKMQTWLSDVTTRIAIIPEFPEPWNQGYIIDPPFKEVDAEESGRTLWRFSCVGLILCCFENVSIHLLDWRSGKIPLPDEKAVRENYFRLPLAFVKRRYPSLLDGPGPWRLVLPGYVFHSMSRDDASIRARPHLPSSAAEANFPL